MLNALERAKTAVWNCFSCWNGHCTWKPMSGWMTWWTEEKKSNHCCCCCFCSCCCCSCLTAPAATVVAVGLTETWLTSENRSLFIKRAKSGIDPITCHIPRICNSLIMQRTMQAMGGGCVVEGGAGRMGRIQTIRYAPVVRFCVFGGNLARPSIKWNELAFQKNIMTMLPYPYKPRKESLTDSHTLLGCGMQKEMLVTSSKNLVTKYPLATGEIARSNDI